MCGVCCHREKLKTVAGLTLEWETRQKQKVKQVWINASVDSGDTGLYSSKRTNEMLWHGGSILFRQERLTHSFVPQCHLIAVACCCFSPSLAEMVQTPHLWFDFMALPAPPHTLNKPLTSVSRVHPAFSMGAALVLKNDSTVVKYTLSCWVSKLCHWTSGLSFKM